MRLCPLCRDHDSSLFHKDLSRIYYRCRSCDLVFVPPRYYPTPSEEKERYDQHRNNPCDIGYRRFLNRLVDPFSKCLPAGAKGLDFGSGPTSAVSILFAERGVLMENFDPFYADNRELLDGTYDFLTCVETVEHFHYPDREWKLMINLIKIGGQLAIMTQTYSDNMNFKNWYYKNDKTHVCFYSKETFQWLALQYYLKAEFKGTSVVFFTKTHP